ncbi:MAG: ATPase [Clostridia bacterium]|nr:ATPase [Clostridia bacterium]
MTDKIKALIDNGDIFIGMELGSTRIKAVVTDNDGNVIASGAHSWENKLENGVWIYTAEQIHAGLKACYSDLLNNVKEKYHTVIKNVKAIGISGMMHGYIALDKNKNVLAPFATWRNNITESEAEYLSSLFEFNIPQRWSIAHLYRAVKNKEPHLEKIDYLTTLSGYIHYLLTDQKVLGICEASGMFPIDPLNLDYDRKMLEKFNCLLKENNLDLKTEDILPKVLTAGKTAGVLTNDGAAFLDVSGNLKPDIPLCPPEGDAGTGMVATNSIKPKTGNISAGTSAFAMIVLEKALSKVYKEFDIVHTPDGNVTVMVHSNNCTTEINSWVALFKEVLKEFNADISYDDLYEKLFNKATKGKNDCGGLVAYCFHSGEHLLGLSEGCPMFLHKPDSDFSLANFMRAQIYSCFGVLKSGMDFLKEKENVTANKITAHGGIFKTKGVAQDFLAAALNTPVAVYPSANEGGAWGIALLAMYLEKSEQMTLGEFLDEIIFKNLPTEVANPDELTAKGYEAFMKMYNSYLPAEFAAAKVKNN